MKAKRIVFKVGTSSLTNPDGSLSRQKVKVITQQLALLHESGHELILVSSGAVAAGFGALGFKKRPTKVADKQASAAVGQGLLMEEYTANLLLRNIVSAQILLTQDDFADQRRYKNAHQALSVLLNRGAIPIINENDTVSIAELKVGDNDTLSAQVAAMVQADLLVLLTDVDGLYTANPSQDPTAKRLDRIEHISREMIEMAGGAGLIQAVVENAIVPVIETGTGIVHVYVDKEADFQKALAIIENAKTSRPSVCNAMEVLLVDQAIASDFLPLVKERLVDARERSVELRLDEQAQAIISGTAAQEQDFDTEFLDYILAVKIVDGVEEAVDHIEAHSTHHSDAIVTENPETAAYFTQQVDSAAVYVNASTRFTDGGQFGLGCEMGISTQKLHARGPMGLREMTSYKYIVSGNGQVR